MIQTCIISNSNIEFILPYLQETAEKHLPTTDAFSWKCSPYGNLYQILIKNDPLHLIVDYVFFLCTIDDFMRKEHTMIYNEDNDYNQIDTIVNVLKTTVEKSSGNFYFMKLNKQFHTPFDNTQHDITQLIEYVNLKVSQILKIKMIDFQHLPNKADIRFYLQTRSPFTLDYYQYLSEKIVGIIANNLGHSIKCIVLDLDNTLWGGILADDGIDGIQIGNEYPQNTWNYFQSYLKHLKMRGILLTICSKNNESDVLKALSLTKNLLNLDDFIIIKANWDMKSKNIREISNTLNISQNHMLFIDDSPIEREEVRQNSQGCRVLNIKNADPIEYVELISQYPLLVQTENILNIDKTRHETYLSKISLECNKSEMSLEKFYYSLQTNIIFYQIKHNKEHSIYQRAKQLLSKTNQFNLNKKHISDTEFENFVNRHTVILLEYSDKYTQNDQVGVILLQSEQSHIIVENIVLSCRVFERDFETCIFALLDELAGDKNIIGKIIKTDKNAKFHNIYDKFHYTYNTTHYIKDPNVEKVLYPPWIKCDNTNISIQSSYVMNKIQMIIHKEDQEIFCQLSNDCNPIHLNLDYVSKTVYCKPIVYGVLGILKAFEKKIVPAINSNLFKFIKVRFDKYINIDTLVDVYYYDGYIKICTDGELCTYIEYELDDTISATFDLTDNLNILEEPLSNDEPVDKYNHHMSVNNALLKKHYPILYNYYNNRQIWQIINTSTFVGMITPGMYSIFNSLEIIDDRTTEHNCDDLFFCLNNFDKEYKICNYDFYGKYTCGKITSIYRNKPVIQKRLKNIERSDIFKDENVLVIGGSRGLGEVISKLFHANGAKVTLTYCNSHKEAEKIQNESNQEIRICKYNAIQDYDKINELTKYECFTKIFYMATPSVTNQSSFNLERFLNYVEYYCIGFKNLLENINMKTLKHVYYPSTVFLDKENTKYREYTLAKKIGEHIVDAYRERFPYIRFEWVRLSPMKTDLTNGLINLGSNPYEYFLKYISSLTHDTVSYVPLESDKPLHTYYTESNSVDKTSINEVKKVILDGIFHKYDNSIIHFTDLQTFDSLKMIMIVNAIKKYFEVSLSIDTFFDYHNNLLTIEKFCEIVLRNITLKNNNDESTQLSYVKTNDKDKFNEFITNKYGPNYPYIQDDILYSFFRGNRDNAICTQLPFLNVRNSHEEILGILGVVKIYVQIYNESKTHIIPAVEILEWYFRDNARKHSLSPVKHLMNENQCVLVSGLQKNNSMPIFKHLDFHIIEQFNVYVLPLKYSYFNLLLDNTVSESEINSWIENIKTYMHTFEILDPVQLGPELYKQLESCWYNFSSNHNIFTFHKNFAFFEWKLSNLYHKYKVNGNPDDGYIIWREEITYTSNIGVRILDLIPGMTYSNKQIILLVRRFVNYCIFKNYELIDLYCTSILFQDALFKNCFGIQNKNNTGKTSVSVYFANKSHFQNRNMGFYLQKAYKYPPIIHFMRDLIDLNPPRCGFCKRTFCPFLFKMNKCTYIHKGK